MKKTTLLLTGTALALGATSAFAGSHTGSITAVSWGGAYTKSQIEAYHKPWTAATGNTVVSEDYSGGIADTSRSNRQLSVPTPHDRSLPWSKIC